MAKEEPKKYTRFVVGGMYRQVRGDRTVYATMRSAEMRANGRRYGTLDLHGQIDITIIENTDAINEWELVAAPLSVELHQELLELVERLRSEDAPKEASDIQSNLESLKKRKAG